ncbi:MAG: phosphoglycerate dehydrogenase [Patescibacteria group bacterium]
MKSDLSYPKEKLPVLLLENVHPAAVELLEREGYPVERVKGSLSEDELIARVKDVAILGIRSATHVTEKVFAGAQHLIAVGAFCMGSNQIDLRTAARKGVAVFNAPFSNTRSVVELVIGLIIMLNRSVFDRSRDLHAGVWNKTAEGAHEIRQKKLGIVGYGNIGSQLSVLAESLGMEVYFYDAEEKLALGNAKKCSTLKELLQTADIVTLHIDGRAVNKGLMGMKEFSSMKDRALFLNLSRGSVVDVPALAEALTSGKLGGAALDVFPDEPPHKGAPFTSPLQNLPNVILTPHIGGSTQEAQENIAQFVAERLTRFMDEGSTALSVNLPNITLPTLMNAHRFLHFHQNVPGVLAKINNILASHSMNIVGQYLGTNDDIGYVITDVMADYKKEVVAALKEIPETVRFRTLY